MKFSCNLFLLLSLLFFNLLSITDVKLLLEHSALPGGTFEGKDLSDFITNSEIEKLLRDARKQHDEIIEKRIKEIGWSKFIYEGLEKQMAENSSGSFIYGNECHDIITNYEKIDGQPFLNTTAKIFVKDLEDTIKFQKEMNCSNYHFKVDAYFGLYPLCDGCNIDMFGCAEIAKTTLLPTTEVNYFFECVYI